jgi:hypothetical protein
MTYRKIVLLAVCVLCLLALALVSCDVPMLMKPAEKSEPQGSERVEMEDKNKPLEVRQYFLSAVIGTVEQWNVALQWVNALNTGKDIQPVCSLTVAEGAEITLPAAGSAQNPELTLANLVLVVKGAEGASIPKLILGTNGNLLAAGENQKLVLENLILEGKSGNTASLIRVTGGELELNNAVITGNIRTAGDGGGVFLEAGTLVMSGSSAIRDNAAGSKGGGVFMIKGSSLLMKDSSALSRNSALKGAGIACDRGAAGSIIMQDQSVVGGQDAGNYDAINGAGIALFGSAPHTVLMKDSAEISHNTTRLYANIACIPSGGGIHVDVAGSKPAQITLTDFAVICANKTGTGAGVNVANGGSVTLKGDSNVRNNEAMANSSDRNGGGVALVGKGPHVALRILENAAITGNYARYGGGVFVKYASAVFTEGQDKVVNNTSDYVYNLPPRAGPGNHNLGFDNCADSQ